MLAFQLFALLLIAAALLIVTVRTLRAQSWSVRELLRETFIVGSSGVAGAIAGLLLGYAFNDAAFGHFGVDIAGWRQAAGASDSRAALAAANVREVLSAASRASGHLLWPVMLAATGAWSVLAVRGRGDVRIVWLVLAMLVGVVLAPVSVALLSGAPVQERRGGLTVWFAAITALVLLANIGAARWRASAFSVIAAMTTMAMWLTGQELASCSRIRQSHDVHLAFIAQDVRSALGAAARARSLIAIGKHHPFDSLGSHDEWRVRALLRSRLEPVLVGSVVYCASTSCEALRAQSLPSSVETQPVYPNTGYIRQTGDVLLLRFGDQSSPRPRLVPPTSR